ncbi:PACE efflux transporter [Corallincola platygyrae]|uniref:PACE efflux transporter n=1 Tax=Corallincola platygyrae TaxID=1193278 RepID=A0ABW4XNM9_9GAMM
MRTQSDRIRHTLGYQLGSIGVVMPMVSYFTGHPMWALGVLAVVFATLCASWNYLFTGWFDRRLARSGRLKSKTLKDRCLHAIGIELGILWMTTPLIAWWLSLGLWHALTMDIALVALYMVYTLLYNWLYDKLFPIKPQGIEIEGAHHP